MGRTVGRRSVEMMTDYILSQDHEYDDCIRHVRDNKETGNNKSIQRKIAQDHIWYVAYKARYGAREANKAVTELLGEV